MDRGAWRATDQRVTESDTNERLSTMYIPNTHLKKKKSQLGLTTVHPSAAEYVIFKCMWNILQERPRVRL